jgi:hypothetical protein
VLLRHLLIDAVEILLAAGDSRADARLQQTGADGVEDAVDHLAPVTACRLQGLLQHSVARGEQVPEGQLLKFLVERVQP